MEMRLPAGTSDIEHSHPNEMVYVITGDLPGAAFDQDLMTSDMYLVHPEHPFQRTPELGSSASSL